MFAIDLVVIDLVDPLPKSKGGVKFVLTYICMTTRWPDGVALRTGAAPEVDKGLVSIFTRTGQIAFG